MTVPIISPLRIIVPKTENPLVEKFYGTIIIQTKPNVRFRDSVLTQKIETMKKRGTRDEEYGYHKDCPGGHHHG
jgi:hypothetical protein